MKTSSLTLPLVLALGLGLAACATDTKNSGATGNKSTASAAQSAPQPTATPAQKAAQQNQTAPATGNGVSKTWSKEGDFEGEIVGTVAPGSKFSKLSIGISRKQAEKLIGKPGATKTYQPGKNWIEVSGALFEKDRYRYETFYKGEGRLLFAKNGEELYRIVADTTEDGRK
ncbi:hypothetical protein IGB42_00030 [Andreprevotia sp. IGB-42]|uniref:hypothetical protein n=1 Tax=Andreprevotia sp. IGB-42 TaxID=2497473 RepID=UPI0013580989|nr:hypothetical protein [Andreprevotia sp. IGB-42]KAF0814954.1 hypothetical protein IGB42_00030 [Andreprevotia sp. IGB-42]